MRRPRILALLYSTQALLPEIGGAFGVGATASSLTVSFATGALALGVVPMSRLAGRLGRPRTMIWCLGVALVTVILGALAPALWMLLLLRALDGLALAGVIAVAMSHIGAQVHPELAAAAIGVYVSGTSVGGLLGRVVPATVREFASWRWSMIALAVVAGVCVVAFAVLVPPARTDRATRQTPHGSLRALLANPDIRRLCGVALLMMGGFVAVYNYLTFRLTEAPFRLSPAGIGFVFLAYLAGTASSSVAARLTTRYGRRRVVLAAIAIALVGLLATVPDSLVCVLGGLVVFTAGFFAVHGVASGWTATVVPAERTTASALYVMAYYLGSSIGGAAIGLAWTAGGWPLTVACVGACCLGACALAAGIRR